MTCLCRTRLALCCALASSLPAGPVLAQDATLAPNSGSTTLVSGFTPDPFTVSIPAGGSEDASDASSDCVGKIADAPDYSVEFTAGEYVLSFVVAADVDTTLLINDPNGNWFCNDDNTSVGGSNPGIKFSSPASGRYDIWVGVYDFTPDDYPPTTLLISEQDEENWPAMVANLGSSTAPAPAPAPTQPTTPARQPPRQMTQLPAQPAIARIQYGSKL